MVCLFLLGWYGTLHFYPLEIVFVPTPANPSLYVLDAGNVILVVYVNDTVLSASDEEYVLTIIELFKERFDMVDLRDVKFLLGLGIRRNVNAETTRPGQDAYAQAVLDKVGMANVHPAKTPAEEGRYVSRRRRLCRQRPSSFSGLPRVLSLT